MAKSLCDGTGGVTSGVFRPVHFSRRRMLASLVLVWSLIVQSAAATPAGDTPSFRVIVHQSNPVSSIQRSDISAMFMKRTRRWSDGVEILPVDHGSTSRLRAQFSQSIHTKSVAYVDRYWQRLIFSGRAVPPPQLGSDEAVIDFVKKNRGAIGYVSADGILPPEVKAITVKP
jgi:hypothetical protein